MKTTSEGVPRIHLQLTLPQKAISHGWLVGWLVVIGFKYHLASSLTVGTLYESHMGNNLPRAPKNYLVDLFFLKIGIICLNVLKMDIFHNSCMFDSIFFQLEQRFKG